MQYQDFHSTGLPTPPKPLTAGLPHHVPSAIAVRCGRGRETRARAKMFTALVGRPAHRAEIFHEL